MSGAGGVEYGQSTGDLVVRRAGALGHILLNRPKALNALTHPMIAGISATLSDWESEPGVENVLISGAGDRGLCAGGDIVAIYRDAVAGTGAGIEFWAAEYSMNAQIARYPKPYVAFMDGVVLGGGIGVSAHGSFRVVTERTRMGMPEVGIGFAPDVGGTYLLSRAPGQLGTHLAMTGGTATGADAVMLGFADHFVDSADLPALAAALEREPAADAVARFALPVPPAPLASEREWIDECYAGDDPAAIVERLNASPHAAAREAAATIVAKSPTSVSVALAAIRRAAREDSLEAVLDQEFRTSVRLIGTAEMLEGIRAQVIDKDRNPKWSPATLGEVSATDVAGYFASLGDRELGLARAAATS